MQDRDCCKNAFYFFDLWHCHASIFKNTICTIWKLKIILKSTPHSTWFCLEGNNCTMTASDHSFCENCWRTRSSSLRALAPVAVGPSLQIGEAPGSPDACREVVGPPGEKRCDREMSGWRVWLLTSVVTAVLKKSAFLPHSNQNEHHSFKFIKIKEPWYLHVVWSSKTFCMCF